jgi:hypothetical protein
MRDWYPVLITFLFTALSVVFKLLSRRDKDPAPLRNDLYIAQSLAMGSVSALAVYLIKAILNNNPTAGLSCTLLLIGYIVMIGILVCLERWAAWEDVDGKFRRKVALGIVIPDLLGVFGYFIVFFSAKTWNL